MRHVTWCVLSGAVALSCGGASVAPDDSGPSEVASVRLFVGQGDVTDHLALVGGQTMRIEVRLYAADGDRIDRGDADFDVQFAFAPDSFATAAPVAGAPLQKDVRPVARAGTPGALRVLCDDRRLMFVKQFGPFDALVH
jgi:hypothetical protein